MSDDYAAFLKGKAKLAPFCGYEVELDEINPALTPHTRALVQWGVRGGRRAWFAAFGLHKTATQIEALRLLKAKAGGEALIVLPLGVRQEFFREARERFHGEHAVSLRFIRRPEEIDGGDHLYLTNYETVRDGKLDPGLFTTASLDEASVLRSFGSKTYQEFLRLFEQVRFRFVATATPSPNRYKELIHYAGYLGVMDTGQALTRWFQRDSKQANNLTLFPHKEREFWLWVASWAIFLQRPSDLGFSDDGYELPPIKVTYHEVKTDLANAGQERDGQGILFRDAAIGLAEEARERRDTLPARIVKLQEILAGDPASHRILWHDLEDERQAIERAVPTAVSIYGAQDLEPREQAVMAFGDGAFQYLAAKPVLAGSGCNLQRHCHKAVFLGVNHKFNDFIQAIHRIQRFGQTAPVEIDVIYAESEREVLRSLQTKWTRHEEMVAKMSEIIREHGLSRLEMADLLARSIGVERLAVKGQDWLAANNDCVEECKTMADQSVDLIVTSIPFANHYEYTPLYNDFGHTDGNDHFWRQMDFLTPELLRILKPGRLACIHVKDRILFGNVTGAGAPTVSPFHAETIFHYRRHGFDYLGLITIVTDVVRENAQTYRLGWTEMTKDGTKMGVGSPEYVVLLRKPQTDRGRGYADEPVKKDKADYTRARWQVDAHAFWRSSGNRLLTAAELAGYGPDVLAKVFTEQSLREVYDYEHHVQIGEALEARGALPASFMAIAPGSHHDDVWHDVNRMLTLNGEQARRGLENHVCPLQWDIVDRLIRRYSNPGELVFDAFGGLMTVPYRALHLGRQGRGVELSTAYFLDGVRYLQAKERELAVPALFDLETAAEQAA